MNSRRTRDFFVNGENYIDLPAKCKQPRGAYVAQNGTKATTSASILGCAGDRLRKTESTRTRSVMMPSEDTSNAWLITSRGTVCRAN